MSQGIVGGEDRIAAGTEPRGAGGPAALRRVSSTALFRDGREVIIVHRGQEYRLRITRSDKLILTK